MNTDKFTGATPGPYQVGRIPDKRGKGGFSNVEYAIINKRIDQPEEAEANAALFAVAPRLLAEREEAKDLVRRLSLVAQSGTMPVDVHGLITEARTLLAKMDAP